MRGLIIGRFQIMHNAHYEIIKYLAEKVEEVVIGLGSAEYDYRNPKPDDLRVKHCLSLDERIDVINGCIDNIDRVRNTEVKKTIVPLYDSPSDEEWVKSTLEAVGRFDYLFTEKPEEIDWFGDHAQMITWPYESPIRNGIVIDNIIHGREYKHLLPEFCASYLESINIRQRLLELHEIDAQLFGHLYGMRSMRNMRTVTRMRSSNEPAVGAFIESDNEAGLEKLD